MDEEKFISLVENNPILYDKNHNDFKDNEKKNMIWKQIADELEVNENAVKKRWKSLRERFGKESRERASGSSTSIEWHLYEQLMFLRKHILRRGPGSLMLSNATPTLPPMVFQLSTLVPKSEAISPTEAILSAEATTPPEAISPDEVISADEAISPTETISSDDVSPTPKFSFPRQPTKKKRKIGAHDEIDSAILKATASFDSFVKSRSQERQYNETIRGFGQMAMSILSKFNDKKQVRVIKQCTDILMDAQMEE
ncbi:transcription factor Adf-1-like [Teleopsis dalmanni]|uniref:transcription factor Adf-1-like n=1 Tax=Teleopsis dalmanni TaxID=139649 RepID=UPI0018CCEE3E|nr:transcription factor Adf-1-like [Teleopsis dalmanni]